MAKITEIFNLNKTQYELDFINIDIEKDAQLFIDPYWISKQDCEFTIECDMLIKSFFTKLIRLLKQNKITQALQLCSHLNESNEICLGYSRKRGTNGSGIGSITASKFCNALKNCKALESDILVNIEDAKIFLDDLDVDRISDMVANIIGKPLLEYTIKQCKNYNIPLIKTQTKYYWSGETLSWERENEVEQLIFNEKRILLVPKKIVSDTNKYSWQNFLQHYILNAMIEVNLAENTSLVMSRKNGEKYVTKKSIRKKFENDGEKLDKDFCEKFAIEHPEVFEQFKNEIIARYTEAELEETTTVSDRAKHFIQELKKIKPGRKEEAKYHDTIFDIIIFALGSKITNPAKEVKIHDGRKRIDIMCLNSSTSGILYDIPNIYKIPLNLMTIECKNYSNDLGNPEVDQLAGRFSPMRAKCGFLLFRSVTDYNTLIKRCQDTYRDDRGLIIPLSDEDIFNILDSITKNENSFDQIVRDKIFQIMAN